MHSALPHHQRPPRLVAIVATVALHLVLLAMWQSTLKPRTHEEAGKTVAFEWLRLLPPAAQTAPPVPAKTRAVPAPQRRASTPAAPAPATLPQPPAPTVAVTTAAAPSTDDILRQARRDIGKIDRELRATSLDRIHAPVNTAQTRLEAGMQAAADAVPPKWFEAPHIETLVDPGGYGRRVYKVVSALRTYCITVESNHAPDGLDTMKDGIKQKVTQCPIPFELGKGR